MSISSDITRIKGAKDALKTAIEGKGVTVLSATLIDGYPALVDSITGGTDTSDATLTAGDMLYGVTGYGPAGTKLTGTGAMWQYVTTLRDTFSSNTALPETLDIYAPNCKTFQGAFSNSGGVKNVTLTGGILTALGMNTVFQFSSAEVVTINADTSAVTNWDTAFGRCSIKTIVNPINCPAMTSQIFTFRINTALENITFVPSVIKIAVQFTEASLLSNASLISIANGLSAANPNTLTLHATSKTNCNNIMVDNNSGTAVPGTAMSLTAFVTSVKGWTIA